MSNNKKETSIGIIPLLVGNLRWPIAPLFESSFKNLNKTKKDDGIEEVDPSEILLNKNRENGAAPVGGVGELTESEVLLNKYLRVGGQKK